MPWHAVPVGIHKWAPQFKAAVCLQGYMSHMPSTLPTTIVQLAETGNGHSTCQAQTAQARNLAALLSKCKYCKLVLMPASNSLTFASHFMVTLAGGNH